MVAVVLLLWPVRSDSAVWEVTVGDNAVGFVPVGPLRPLFWAVLLDQSITSRPHRALVVSSSPTSV